MSSLNAYQSVAAVLTQESTSSALDRLYDLAVQDFRRDHANGQLSDEQLQRIVSKVSKKEVLQDVETAKAAKANRGLSRIKGPLKGTLEFMERFGHVADTMVQSNPTISALVWGSVRAVMVIARDIFDTYARLVELVEKINFCTDRFTRYLEIFGLRDLLPSRLAQFFKVVIQFSLRAEKIYKRPKIKTFGRSLWSSLKQPFDELMSKLTWYGEEVDKAAQVVSLADAKEFLGIARRGLKIQSVQQQDDVPARTHMVPDLLSNTFVGNEDVLTRLGAHLLESDQRATARRAALWGFPGVGKSQVAYRYIAINASRYQHIVHVRARERSEIFSTYQCLARLHKLFDLEGSFNDERLVLEKVKQWFGNTSSWLLIFDDVREVQTAREFLPINGLGDILVTMRDEITAQSLAGEDGAFEIQSFGMDLCVELVYLLLPTQPRHEQITTAAESLGQIVQGLPIAIEQCVILSRRRNQHLSVTVTQLRERRQLVLDEQHETSLHEDQLSTGILIEMILETLTRESPRASALFKVLIYLDTSAVQIELLKNASARLLPYLGRDALFDRGTLNAKGKDVGTLSPRSDGSVQLERRSWNQMAKLWKNDFKVYLSRSTEPTLDETEADKLLREFLVKDAQMRHVLTNPNQIENALLILQQAGLVRRDSRNSTIWLHDLTRDLSIHRMVAEAPAAHKVNAICALTFVFLAFPVPRRLPFRIHRVCHAYLSHALSTLTHCRRFALDTAAGPELMHIVGSMLDMLGTATSSSFRIESNEWYQKATAGYYKAWNRLKAQKSDVQIALAARRDMSVVAPGICFGRIDIDYERFGQAPQRTLDTALKLGGQYAYQRAWKDAEYWVGMAVRGYTYLLGGVHEMTFESLGLLVHITTESGNSPKALGFALQRASIFERKYGAIENGTKGAGCAADVGHALERVGDYTEALRWLSRAISGLYLVYGCDPITMPPIFLDVARVNRKLHRHEDAKTWSSRANQLRSRLDPKDELSLDALNSLAISAEALGDCVDAEMLWRMSLESLLKIYGPYERLHDGRRRQFLKGTWNLTRYIESEGKEAPDFLEQRAIEEAIQAYGPVEDQSFKVDPDLILATDLDF